MKHNATTALSNPQVLLVPYSEQHVPDYHEWMKDPSLQEATASEPLSLEEEYAMQKSWRTDRDKLTFVICLPMSTTSSPHITIGSDDAPDRMIGDINLFLSDSDDEDQTSTSGDGLNLVGEIELMIARKDFRRKGLGGAALQAFMHYIISNWRELAQEYAGDGAAGANLLYLRVKINQSNVGSTALFEEVGFTQTAQGANYFGEVELRRKVDAADLDSAPYTVLEYITK